MFFLLFSFLSLFCFLFLLSCIFAVETFFSLFLSSFSIFRFLIWKPTLRCLLKVSGVQCLSCHLFSNPKVLAGDHQSRIIPTVFESFRSGALRECISRVGVMLSRQEKYLEQILMVFVAFTSVWRHWQLNLKSMDHFSNTWG